MSEIDEEIEVINSIYEGCAEYNKENGIVKLMVPETSTKITLFLPAEYPKLPPKLRSVSLKDQSAIKSLQVVIDSLFQQDEVFLFTFIDEVKDDVLKMEASEVVEAPVKLEVKGSQFINKWSSSNEVRDRGSVFIGRATKANSEEEMSMLVEDLLNDKKVSQANINMVAWRIKISEDLYAQDFDDGGEPGAGACMLHVLRMAQLENVVCLVSRYFSGHHIGPDRFKHIKNCARDALVEGGYLPSKDQ